MLSRRLLLLILCLPLWSLLAPAGASQEARPGLDKYRLEKGLALAGHDPLSYFAEFGGEPVRGSADWTLTHRGVLYRFSSEANRQAFAAAPERYEPAYGGWCAHAMSMDQRVAPDPTLFRIQDGRLLLFSKGGLFGGNRRDAWVKEGPSQRRTLADGHWQAFSGEGPAPIQEQDRDRPDLEQLHLGPGGLALQGYDPLSYFLEYGGSPQRGDKRFALRHRGVVYRFLNAEHRELFRATPERFEPAYGGWCAYAMADGDKVEIDPRSFVIQEGRLLLFYDGLLGDTRKQWLGGDVTAQARRADGRWSALIEQPRR